MSYSSAASKSWRNLVPRWTQATGSKPDRTPTFCRSRGGLVTEIVVYPDLDQALSAAFGAEH
jgi:hypothetical protein